MSKIRLFAGIVFITLMILPAAASAQEPLQPGETLLGNIAALGDSVEYVVNASQPLQIEVIPVAASLAPQIAVLQENASLGVWYALNAGETLRADIQQSGNYRIRVSAGSAGAATGAFSITIRPADSPETLPIPQPESTEESPPVEAIPLPERGDCLLDALRGTIEGAAVLVTPIGNAEMTSPLVTDGLLQIPVVQTGEPICDGTMASLVLLESSNGQPQQVEIDGAMIEFTSAIALRANRDTDAFQNRPTNNPAVLHLIVLDGSATVSGQEIPAGYTIMSAADPQSGDRLRWVGERPLNDEEFALLEQLVSIDVPMPPR
jgi:hypothetical protein